MKRWSLGQSATLCLLLGVACSGGPAAAQSALQYRVSGVIITADKRLAMVEGSDGTQALYRPGDRLESYLIEAVEPGGVRLADGGPSIFLPLRGEAIALDDIEAINRLRDLDVADGNTTRALDYESAWREIIELRRESAALASGGAALEGVEKRRRALAENVNKALGLPAQTVITAIDNGPVGSPEEALLRLGTPLENRRTMRLEVAGVPGIEVIYTTPEGA